MYWWAKQYELTHRIYLNKRRGASRHKCGGYLSFFKNCTRQIYFFYIIIQRYTFYLLIFVWTDTKLILNLELREKFTRWKKPELESFMITRTKLSAVTGAHGDESELLCRCGTIYNVQSILMSLSSHRGCGAYSRAGHINFFVPDAALIRGRRLFE